VPLEEDLRDSLTTSHHKSSLKKSISDLVPTAENCGADLCFTTRREQAKEVQGAQKTKDLSLKPGPRLMYILEDCPNKSHRKRIPADGKINGLQGLNFSVAVLSNLGNMGN
jgi:hypothetical protein